MSTNEKNPAQAILEKLEEMEAQGRIDTNASNALKEAIATLDDYQEKETKSGQVDGQSAACEALKQIAQTLGAEGE